MSTWGTVTEKDGTKSVLLLDFPPLVITIIMGVIAAITIPNMIFKPISSFIVSFSMVGIELILFIFAKISVFKKGLLFSIGTRSMTTMFRTFYYIGYIFLILGSLGTLIIIGYHR